MASGAFTVCLLGFHGGDFDLVNDDVSAILVDLDQYTPSLNSNTSLADVPEVAILSEALLTGKALSDKEFQADPTTFPAVTVDSGVTVGAVIVFLSADTLEDSTLLFLIDDAAEFPVTPDGSDIRVTWGAGSGVVHEFT